jgi:cell division protein ZipA
MDDLRLILLLVGAGVILGVYVWTRIQRRAAARPARPKSEPVINSRTEEPDDVAVQQELQRMQKVMSGAESSPGSEPVAGAGGELIIVVSVVAGEGKPFDGEALGKAFANNDLRFGDKGIFHRMMHRSGEDLSVFGIANMVKPGDFGDAGLLGFETPGITLFLQLPGPQDSLVAFDDFVQTAERLAVELGGQLRDEKHCVITHQTLMAMRDSIARARLKPQIAS